MEKWVVTGVSGSGRIEILEELRDAATARGASVSVHDVGGMMRSVCEAQGMPMVDDRILDRDHSQLRILRALVLKNVENTILKNPDVDLHFIGVHATFRWKGRLIPGISYPDLISIEPDGIVNIVHDVQEVYKTNKKNPKWHKETLPGPELTQDWMIEEEFVSEVLSEVLGVPLFLVARKHRTENLLDLFLSEKKMVYLSFPITSVAKENPELLARIQGEFLEQLEERFVVFNPLAIEDMRLTYEGGANDVPDLLERLNPRAIKLIKNRTVERDFQFIDQADAVVVFYPTDKLSPGVLAEVFYAHRNQKPVYIMLAGKRSPFIESAATEIFETPEDLFAALDNL